VLITLRKESYSLSVVIFLICGPYEIETKINLKLLIIYIFYVINNFFENLHVSFKFNVISGDPPSLKSIFTRVKFRNVGYSTKHLIV
jgi:hypothetical protein